MKNAKPNIAMIVVIVAVITTGLVLMVQNITVNKLKGEEKLQTQAANQPGNKVVITSEFNSKMNLAECKAIGHGCFCYPNSSDNTGGSCSSCSASSTCWEPIY